MHTFLSCIYQCIFFFLQAVQNLKLYKALRKVRKRNMQRAKQYQPFGKKLPKLIQIKSRWSECESPNEKPRGKKKKSIDLISQKRFSGFILHVIFKYCGESGQQTVGV